MMRSATDGKDFGDLAAFSSSCDLFSLTVGWWEGEMAGTAAGSEAGGVSAVLPLTDASSFFPLWEALAFSMASLFFLCKAESLVMMSKPRNDQNPWKGSV
ncbi:hypothetical protein E2C01_075828 [Portunus trituberculatus]|uniref:Uncharacterized protein n=1 Tax=Portunus trituberculatus TaxID=210409 RepID=A0A5B7I757_PORTR|nr:hypothetical protein [Portunus trituberculatus]